MKISISVNKIKEQLATYNGDIKKVEYSLKSGNTVGFGEKSTTTLDMSKCPKDFMQHLLDHSDGLTENQRYSIYTFVNGGMSASIDMELKRPSDVHTLITSLKLQDDYNAEVKLNGRWYPIKLTSSYSAPTQYGPATTSVKGMLKLVDYTVHLGAAITSSWFVDDNGDEITLSGKKLFADLNMRHLQQDIDAYRKKLLRADSMNKNFGKVVSCIGPVIATSKAMWGGNQTIILELGSKDIQKKVVIEPELEAQTNHGRENDTSVSIAPFVRAFSLDLKRYVYIDVEDIGAYQFDKTAIKKLVLPHKTNEILTKLFTTNVEQLFGDVLRDKHGGMIILANGSAGVGKTLTAEVFAEMTERPLYVMEMCELGINVERIEGNLETIFRRVTRWNAVLLMDEADVFLYKRGEDLERSVIVGIFLRLMDYYKGLLFLTSNRAEVIDPAFKSRITIRIDYPNLDVSARTKIWDIMLRAANIKVEGGLDGIPELVLNGRQIRNMVRLIRALYGNDVTAQQVKDACNFACK